MRLLPPSQIYKGLEYVTLKRSGMIALVKVVNPKKQNLLGYEVWLIQSHDGYELHGKYIEPAESMPSTNSWGKNGWSYTQDDYQRALKKYKEIQ